MTSEAHKHPHPSGGAWVLWPVATELCQLKLKTDSEWRVLLAVVLTSSRYGGQPARLSIAKLAQMTGLAIRTVQTAVSRLRASGLLDRQGRYGSLSCTLLPQVESKAVQQKPGPAQGRIGKSGSAAMLALPKRSHDCASPNSIHVLIKDIGIETHRLESVLSPKQIEVIGRVLEEARQLTGTDPSELELLACHSDLLGLPPGSTFGWALLHVCTENKKRLARDFTKAVLSLQHDERVQGVDLRP